MVTKRFVLYSRLPSTKKDESLRELVNRFSKEFKCGAVFSSRNWRKRLDYLCVGSEDPKVHGRDVLVGFVNGAPVSVYQFSTSLPNQEAFGEGIFISPELRIKGLAFETTANLYQSLRRLSISRFHVGYSGNFDSAPIRKSPGAQALAEKIVGVYEKAIIECVRTPSGKISRYSIDLTKIQHN